MNLIEETDKFNFQISDFFSKNVEKTSEKIKNLKFYDIITKI